MLIDLDRSRDAIHYRGSRVLKLRRPNRTKFQRGFQYGAPFRPGAVPWNAGTAKPNPQQRLRAKIIALLTEHKELTLRQMSEATGSTRASCWRVCEDLRLQGNCHISEWRPVAGSAGNTECVFKIGHGDDADKPTKKVDVAEDPYALVAVPHPAIGLWGLAESTTPAWNTLTK